MLQMSICGNSNVNSNEIRIYEYIYMMKGVETNFRVNIVNHLSFPHMEKFASRYTIS